MAKVLCVGCPFNPPVIHGRHFAPEPDGVHYAADVPEAEYDKFLIGVEGSPFFLAPAGGPNSDGSGQPSTPSPMDEFRKIRSKADLALAAKEKLGLDLDPEGKMDAMLAAIEAELKLRADAEAAGQQ